MPKDYAKFVPPKSRLKLPYSWPVKLAIVVGLVAAFGGAGIFYYSHQPELLAKMNAFVHPGKAIAKASNRVTSVAAAKPHTVRFDFYEQLPNMQMPADIAAIPSPPAPLEAPVTPKVVSLATAQTVIPKLVTPASIVVPAAAPGRQAFNPDDLNHLLDAEQPRIVAANPPAQRPVMTGRYIIKMGDFDTEAGARGLLKAIQSVGFDGKVMKISHAGRTIYQVQQGPYESMALAAQSQQRMQKRGLTSTIIKSI